MRCTFIFLQRTFARFLRPTTVQTSIAANVAFTYAYVILHRSNKNREEINYVYSRTVAEEIIRKAGMRYRYTYMAVGNPLKTNP